MKEKTNNLENYASPESVLRTRQWIAFFYDGSQADPSLVDTLVSNSAKHLCQQEALSDSTPHVATRTLL